MRIADEPRYVRLTKGIPTCTGACDLYHWSTKIPFRRMLFPDYDLFFIRTGRMAFVWPDGRRSVLKPDEFGLIPPLVLVRVELLAGPLSYWFCHFGFRMTPEHYSIRMQQDYLGPVPEVHVPAVFSAKQAPGVREAYERIAALRFDAPAVPWQYESALLQLVGALKFFAWTSGKGRPVPAGAPPVQDTRLSHVLQQIHADPQRGWTVTELARGVGLSTDRLNMLARRLTGRSVKQLVIRARFERAFSMLRLRPGEELPSIKEVSQKCGFSSQHFFCRQFRKHFQMTPTEFRDQSIQS